MRAVIESGRRRAEDRPPYQRTDVCAVMRYIFFANAAFAAIAYRDHSKAFRPLERFNDLTRYRCIQLTCTLEMFFRQLSHTKVLEAAPNHPMEKRIIGCELVSLPFMTTGFVDFT